MEERTIRQLQGEMTSGETPSLAATQAYLTRIGASTATDRG